MDGLEEAAIAARQAGIVFIPGIEISVTWVGCTIHVVGLHVDATCSLLQTGLAELRKFRAWRAEEIGRRLAQHNIPMAYEGAKALSNGDLISRTHFARFLMQQGFATDERQVFKHFLTNGKPGHVSGQWATLDNAIQWIHHAGGQAVLAHPARYNLTYNGLRQLIEKFKELGGVALEVISSSHNSEECMNMARLTKEFGLLSSAGSDFHNPKTALFEPGQLPKLPDGCIPIWQDWPQAA